MGKDSSKNYTYVYRWTCHKCRFTNLNYNIDVACPECEHGRCDYCEVFKLKVYLDR
ncbi:hypothetical protein C8A03DRAFT_32837 [Achaetomium macrosporum]|uniref:Uncharacterized protein n=1 Tax=Achaetomium macrosporum TaxID=79813 RepID=A0AAN7CDP7_9PEZI|nr:hypothetical protein C8A03DRAFT_32837 [Achaetomium macrosporum]